MTAGTSADVRMSVVRGGAAGVFRRKAMEHHSWCSPQQFSYCLRARDERVRLVRADLLLTGMIFSGRVDTEISFDYGTLSPQCWRADFADIKQLQIKLGSA